MGNYKNGVLRGCPAPYCDGSSCDLRHDDEMWCWRQRWTKKGERAFLKRMNILKKQLKEYEGGEHINSDGDLIPHLMAEAFDLSDALSVAQSIRSIIEPLRYFYYFKPDGGGDYIGKDMMRDVKHKSDWSHHDEADLDYLYDSIIDDGWLDELADSLSEVVDIAVSV